jgi:hypothetical protein
VFKVIVIDDGLRADEVHVGLAEAPAVGVALDLPSHGLVLVRHVIDIPKHGFSGLILGWPIRSAANDGEAHEIEERG